MDSLIFSFGLVFYGAAFVLYLSSLLRTKGFLGHSWFYFLGLGFLFHTVVTIRQAMILVSSASMHIFEILVLFSWSLIALALLLQSRLRMRILLGIVLVMVLVIGCIALGLPEYFHKRVPSLNAFWFGTHILLSLLGYAAFAISLLTGIFYLILERQLKAKAQGPLFSRLPPLDHLEFINFRSLWAGALLLAFGLTSGIVWSRWSGLTLAASDPKVLAAWITLSIYGLMIYVRSTARWRGKKVAYMTVMGFSAVLVTFFVMNYFSKGHGFF